MAWRAARVIPGGRGIRIEMRMSRYVFVLALSLMFASCARPKGNQNDTASAYSDELSVLLSRHVAWTSCTNRPLADALLKAMPALPSPDAYVRQVNIVVYGRHGAEDVCDLSVGAGKGTIAELLDTFCSACSMRWDVVDGVIAIRGCIDPQPIALGIDAATSNVLRRKARGLEALLAVECSEFWLESAQMLECVSGWKVVVDPRVEETHLHGQHVCDPVNPYLTDLPLEYAMAWACRMHGARCQVVGDVIFILPDDSARQWHESRRCKGKDAVWPDLEKAYRRFIAMASRAGLRQESSDARNRYIELFPQ